MIMNGATPRLVGVWGTLGSLALGVLLLPVNATWAQKTDDKKEVRIIVKTDDDTSAGEQVVVAPDTELQYVVARLAEAVDDNGSEQVVVELKSDDHSTTVSAGSIKEAIGKLRQQIKAISDKTPVSEKDRDVIKALEGAIKGLEKAGETIVQPNAARNKAEAAQKLVLRLHDVKVAHGGAASAGRKADIEAERRKIEKLTQALRDHQRELAEARRKLSELQALAVAEQGRVLSESNLAKSHAHALKEIKTLTNVSSGTGTGGGSSGSTSTGGSSSTYTTTSKSGGTSASSSSSADGKNPKTVTVRARIVGEPDKAQADQKRLADLEKKLDRLLEEVANLRKARDGN
jgi:hypothetical protein